MDFNVVLIEPETSGNIGAIARAMANFGLNKLFLVDPKANYLSEEALARAKHAKEILLNSQLIKLSDIKMFDVLVATTAKLGSKYNLRRLPLSPDEFATRINDFKGSIALIFGREGNGLTNKEIEICDITINIPTHPKYKALNLAHEATIVFYELFKNKNKARFELPSAKEKEVILSKVDNILKILDFNPKSKYETQVKFWRRFLGKSFITKREAFVLFGFFKKLDNFLMKKH